MKRIRIGLSLSGGGYRAAAFHLGIMRYLNKIKVLDKIDFISTVSGGAIIGAAYGIQKDTIGSFEEFEVSFKQKLKTSIIGSVLRSVSFMQMCFALLSLLGTVLYLAIWTTHGFIALLILSGGIVLFFRFQFKIFPVSKVIEDIYDKMFFHKKLLPQLTEKPYLVINATNLRSARLFYFTKENMSDSTYDGSYSKNVKEVFNNKHFPIARAVMCSSSVPIIFTPIEIEKQYVIDHEAIKNLTPILVDGGVYDNQGLHKLTHPGNTFECDLIIASDAGNNLPFEGAYNNFLSLSMRTVEVFMTRIRRFQKMVNLYRGASDKQIAYVSLEWEFKDLMDGFVDNLKSGNVPIKIKSYFNLSDHAIESSSKEDLVQLISKSINLEEIMTRIPTDEQITIARTVGTNLTALSETEIAALALFAELMAEIQIKLYCPELLNQ